MKSNSRALLGLTVLAGLLTAGPARAEDAVQSCEVPDYLLTTESALPKVADAIKSRHPLDILVAPPSQPSNTILRARRLPCVKWQQTEQPDGQKLCPISETYSLPHPSLASIRAVVRRKILAVVG